MNFSTSAPCSGCEHGRWNCSLEHCPVDGGLSPWGSWSSCSLSCGGLGLKTRTRGCKQPAPAHGGRDCHGPRQETTYCQAPDCPGTEASRRDYSFAAIIYGYTRDTEQYTLYSLILCLLLAVIVGPTEEPLLPGKLSLILANLLRFSFAVFFTELLFSFFLSHIFCFLLTFWCL